MLPISSLQRPLNCLCLLLIVSVVQLAGCDAVAPPDREQLRRQDPASPWHVHDHFKVVVEQAEANNLEAVSAGLQRYFPEREDFIELFGKARGEAMWTGYREVIMPTVRTEGAEVLAKRVKAGMTTVELERVGPMFPGRTTRGDHAMFQAMVTRRPMYTIRLRPAEESLGFRLNGFVFVRGKWKAFLKSYEHLPEVKPTPAESKVGETTDKSPGAVP